MRGHAQLIHLSARVLYSHVDHGESKDEPRDEEHPCRDEHVHESANASVHQPLRSTRLAQTSKRLTGALPRPPSRYRLRLLTEATCLQ